MAPATNSSLASLLKRSSLDDHEQLLQASETALKTDKSDGQAQHVKAVALLKLERYEEAVKFIEACGSTLKQSAALEYAYGLYRSGRLADAAQVASGISGNRGASHVEAQARYRLGEAEETAHIYTKIQQQDVGAEEHDLRINQGAIDILGQWSGIPGSVKKPGREDLEAFETAYNAACGSIAKGELAQAEILLNRSSELCKHSEDLTDEQKKEELLPILVQQTYVLFKQGKSKEAEAVADQITISDIEDLATRKIASNNLLLTSKQQENPFLAHKIFNNTPRVPSNNQLFSYQSIPMASNEKTIDLQTYKFTGLIDSAKTHLRKHPGASTDPDALVLSAFEAAAHARNEVGQAAINLVLPHLEQRPNDIGLIMTLVQMYTLTGNSTSAIELVESLFKRLEASTTESEKEIRYHPGLVSILISLYRLQGRRSHIRQELAKSASYWRHKSKPPITLLRAAGVSLLESSTAADISTASEIFSKLYEQQPADKATVAGYIASHAVANAQKVENLAGKLTPVPKLIEGIDIDALEAAGVPQSSNAIAIAASASRTSSARKRAAESKAETPGKPKRVRRSRLPKNFDAASQSKPDPERWLPMRDRSYYRAPKSKKKGRKGDDRTQGGNVNEDLDVSKSSQPKGGEVVGGSGGGGGGGKKKKGKGKK